MNGHSATNGVNGKAQNGNSSVSDMLDNFSELQSARLGFSPPLPATLKGPFVLSYAKAAEPAGDAEKLKEHFPSLIDAPEITLQHSTVAAEHAGPITVGLVLSGGQAPGGHNVIAGLFDHLQARHPGSRMLGFLNGPRGIIHSDFKEITREDMARFRHQGGFHMIGSGRDKIESQQDLQRAVETARKLNLNGLVVVGGDDSNTNAAVLAEHFLDQGVPTSVVGVPKTIDGDLKNGSVAVSFGFDTACKVYSELVGNIMMDAASARKYWHWVRLMGRSASHITLECALQTHPQAALISEEIAANGQGLAGITKHTASDVATAWRGHPRASDTLNVKVLDRIHGKLADIVAARSAIGKDYGVVLLPEGLIEFIPEVGTLIQEINEILADGPDHSAASVAQKLTPASRKVFEFLPGSFQQQLLLDRDPHGNVQVAKIETERLLLELVETEVAARKNAGAFKGKFNGLTHYMGYEGRASLPTNFDATYCYALGHAAGALLGARQTGLMVTLGDLHLPTEQWRVGGTPLPSMMTIERRKGKDKPVIRKALVELEGAPFRVFAAMRQQWSLEDCFRSPGPIQYFGGGIANVATMTLALEKNSGKPISIC